MIVSRILVEMEGLVKMKSVVTRVNARTDGREKIVNQVCDRTIIEKLLKVVII